VSNGTSSAVNGWTATLAYGQSISVTGAWSATASSSGSSVTATPVSYNSSVGANGSVSFGFQGTTSGTAGNPSCSVS
jgi:cellulase/cellobiase CelA1